MAIDIGSYRIKAVVGKQQRNNIKIKNAAMIQTPLDSYEDGNILRIEELKDAILKLLEINHFYCKRTIVTIKSTFLITRELILPSAKAEELDTMVQLEAEQYIPITLDEYVMEYRVLETLKHHDRKQLKILIAALPKRMVENYLNLLYELNLKPMALDTHSNAISKLFNMEMKINDENYNLNKTVAIMDIGHCQINIHIIAKGNLQFSRLIPVERYDKENTTLTMNEWIEEAQKIFQYYTTRGTNHKIDKIFIYGGCSKIKYLSKYIEHYLNIPVVRIEKISHIKTMKTDKNVELCCYLNAIAAILRK
jgi:type IV pilus assembly protein PilM